MTAAPPRSTAVDLPSGRHPAPGRVGQSTAVEQSRAVAEVQAAVVLAHQRPRDENAAVDRMREVCARPVVADRAFYRMTRSGQTVTGSTVHLMRELARLWGNIQYGIAELDRDTTAGGRSEMLARAWDLESNTLVTAAFIVPHARDKGSGRDAEIVTLATLGAVYENNANNGARRLRECIKAVLPSWFVEEAEAVCRQTIERGDGTPLGDRVRAAVEGFAGLGVREDQLARKVGKPAARWTGYDLADLAVIFSSIKRGEVTAADEFPRPGVTAADIDAQAGPPPDTGDRAPGRPSVRVHAALGPWGLAAAPRRADKLAFLSAVLDRPVGSTNDLTADDVRVVLSFLDSVPADDREVMAGEQITRGREILAQPAVAESTADQQEEPTP